MHQPAIRTQYRYFSTLIARVILEFHELIIFRSLCQRRTEIRDRILRLSPFSVYHPVGSLEYREQLRPSHEMLNLTFSLSLFFSLSFSLCPFLSSPLAFYLPPLFLSNAPFQTPPVHMHERNRITASSRVHLALAIILDLTFCSPHQLIR